jgi:hypothetical protein
MEVVVAYFEGAILSFACRDYEEQKTSVRIIGCPFVVRKQHPLFTNISQEPTGSTQVWSNN